MSALQVKIVFLLDGASASSVVCKDLGVFGNKTVPINHILKYYFLIIKILS
jgi:hypothetical protein